MSERSYFTPHECETALHRADRGLPHDQAALVYAATQDLARKEEANAEEVDSLEQEVAELESRLEREESDERLEIERLRELVNTSVENFADEVRKSLAPLRGRLLAMIDDGTGRSSAALKDILAAIDSISKRATYLCEELA